MVSIIILVIVFILITLRKIGNFKIEMWQVMIGGAILNILFGEVSLVSAFKMIDWNIIFFLFCMFSVGSLLEISGYLNSLYAKIFKSSTPLKSLYLFVFLSGLLSSIFMNDTIAVVIVPLIAYFSKRYSISTKPFIMAAAFSITIGSVLSPIGNPQNLLIALSSNMKNPFFTFIKYLFIPTILNLMLIYWIIRMAYFKEFKKSTINDIRFNIKKNYHYYLSKLTVALLLGMICLRIYLSTIGIEMSLILIAGISAIPAIFFSFNQREILKNVDWKTLLFFCGMFIVMHSSWNSGYFNRLIVLDELKSVKWIFILSLILSQFISNVPLVAMFMPVLINIGAGEREFISLACASTISGNLSVLGAASNVIIIQNLESRKMESISSLEFLLIGLPVTVINSIIYYFFIKN